MEKCCGYFKSSVTKFNVFEITQRFYFAVVFTAIKCTYVVFT